MAILKPAKDEKEIKAMSISMVRTAYMTLAADYNRIIDGDLYYCHKCNSFYRADSFYSDKRMASGLFPICKKCVTQMATDYDKKTNTYTDNKEKTKEVFRLLDLPFYDSLYQSALSSSNEAVGEKNRSTAFQQMITMVKSLPQYKAQGWKDSQFSEDVDIFDDENIKISQKTLKNATKRFGMGYSQEDYMFLENQYQDWITRYECNTKAQEEIFERLAFKKWEINKATKSGQATKDLDKTYQDLLATANIQPRQSSMDSTSDAQTFGTLIQKYEETRPLPEIDPELQDVDKIGLYIDVFFRGHASKMLGLKNAFSHLYERFMNKYTVTKPEYTEEEDSEAIFEKVFGTKEDD